MEGITAPHARNASGAVGRGLVVLSATGEGDVRRILILAAILASAAIPESAEKIVKEAMTSGGVKRTYYLFVPASAKDKPAPLIITLHGSGRDGRILVEHWESLAKKEGIVVAGPDATVRDGWAMTEDGPHFLHDLVESLKTKCTFDPKRVYLFGHSAGAVHGLAIGILESEYFAATAAHAGVLLSEYVPYVDRAPRKIPIGIWVGTNDAFFPLGPVRLTRDALNQHGFDAQLTEIKNHTHNYYGLSSYINKDVWEFLRGKQLSADPKYQEYAIQK